MTQSDYILQFLRSPTWRAHTIHSAEEAYIDLLACPEDERPKNVSAMADRWHVCRNKAYKIVEDMKAAGIDPFNMKAPTDVHEMNTAVHEKNTTVHEMNTPPSRDIQDNNISNILPPPKTASAGVREEDIPRAEDVQAYINQIGGALFSGQAFIDYHTAKCLWNSQNVRPLVWQATVRTWRERDKQRTLNKQPNTHNNAHSPAPNYHPSSREAERQQRAQAFAQHISNLMADPTGQLTPDLDF